MDAAAVSLAPPRWLGQLELGFGLRQATTRLLHRRHVGPLLVQRTFNPEPDVCHAYVLHPPGGMVGGDRLDLSVDVGEGAQVLLTTPSANKSYRSAGTYAECEQRFNIQDNGSLEWLPQETIIYDGARLRLQTQIDLAPGARVIGWDIMALGRPAAAECYRAGHLQNRLQFRRAGSILYHERFNLNPEDAVSWGPWALNHKPVVATLFCTEADDSLVAQLRQLELGAAEGDLYGVTRVRDVLLLRWSGVCAYRARQAFIRAWLMLRPLLLKRPACLPRIWAT